MIQKNIQFGDVEIEIAYLEEVNYSIQLNDIPVIHSLSLTNSGEDPVADLEIKITPEHQDEYAWSQRIARIDPKGTWNERGINVHFPHQKLANIDERIISELSFTLSAQDQDQESFQIPIHWLPYNHWPGIGSKAQILASFVLPNHPDLVELLSSMSDLMNDWTGSSALNGYQAKERSRVRKMAQSSFEVLKSFGFRYINPPASFEENGQKVRTPEMMMNSRLGTCLDYSLLVAALLEQSGLHPIVVIIKGHAFTGVWLVDERFPESLTDDPSSLRKRSKVGEMLLFDPNIAVSSDNASFEQAEDEAMGHLTDLQNFEIAVDVNTARSEGVRPIASRVFEEDGSVKLIDHSQRKDENAIANAPSTGVDFVNLEEREKRHLDNLSQEEEEKDLSRLEQWQSKLLDLTLRNRLLNTSHTQKTGVLLYPDVEDLEDRLATGKSFDVNPKPEFMGGIPRSFEELGKEMTALNKEDQVRKKIENSVQSGNLHSVYAPAEHGKRFKKMHREARKQMEETGVNMLHLAVGFLRWFDRDKPGKTIYAPLVLLPANLERKSATDKYKLSLTDDEALLNFSLVEKLRREFSIEVPGLSELPEDASGLDIELIFKKFRDAVLEMEKWDVLEISCLGIFSFTKYLMWNDLRENRERLKDNELVRNILDTTGNSGHESEEVTNDGSQSVSDEENTKQLEKFNDFCVLEADSSQLEAVHAASEGNSFVLQGPPGTGKSQTITNIIAQFLAEDRNVLFVSEKRAALEVVYDRLEEVNLDDFCLRLHSDGANKRAVAGQLGKALEAARDTNRTNWKQLTEKLSKKRRPINKYKKEVHKKREIGLSLFQGISRLTEMEEYDSIELEEDELAFTEEKKRDIQRKAQELKDYAAEVSPLHKHPLLAIRQPFFGPDEEDECEEAISKLETCVSNVSLYLERLSDSIPVPDDTTIESLKHHANCLDKLQHRPPGSRQLLELSDWELIEPRLKEALNQGQEFSKTKQNVSSEFTEKLYELNLKNIKNRYKNYSDSFFLISFVKLFFPGRKLKEVSTQETLPEAEEIINLLKQAERVQELSDKLKDYKFPDRIAGTLWRGTDTDWEQLQKAIEWTSQFRDLINSQENTQDWLNLGQSKDISSVVSDTSQDYIDSVKKLKKTFRNTSNKLKLDQDLAWRNVKKPNWINESQECLSSWLESLDELRSWSHYLEACDDLNELGLGNLIDQLEAGEIEVTQIPFIAEKSVLRSWTKKVFSESDFLRKFDGLKYQRAIEEFRNVDREAFTLARQEVRARICSNVPNVQKGTSSSSEVGLVLREIQKKSKHMPIRKLFSETPNLLPKIAPCMLMSPLSASQYLAENPVDFDLVIFDEASQIPPWEAIGAISRGDQTIVVGDDKQLPPTSFFEKSYESGSVQEMKDLESILDECVAAGLDTKKLTWHYRSRHESLIAFSNHQYYNDELFTFPTALEKLSKLGVSHRHVSNGYYDRGGTSTNEAEAEAIVDEIVSRLKDPVECQRSIGVVTFNQKQQDLIKDLLDEKRRSNPDIEPYFSQNVKEPVFVKNLENVQGDERDVMLFSICYGPDQEGNITMNFGPLNREGGERRLNVAITRAREQLILFSKLKPEQIDLSKTSANAVEHLKDFLNFARSDYEKNAKVQTATAGEGTNSVSAIRQQIRNFVNQKGYDVEMAVGCSGLQVDLAVRHPKDQSKYMLGIDLDTGSYRLEGTARDRERTRINFLEDLGWHLHRVWSVDWWHNKDKQLEKISDKLQKLEEKEPPTINTTTNTKIEQELNEEDNTGFKDIDQKQKEWVDEQLEGELDFHDLEGAEDYETFSLADNSYSQEEFNNDENFEKIGQSVLSIVEKENPVSKDEVFRRVAKCWGYSRISGRIEDRLNKAMESLDSEKQPISVDGFLWSSENPPEEYQTFRPSPENQNREPDEIPKQEAANAALAILKNSLSLPKKELQRKIGKVFGFSKLGANVRDLTEECIDYLIENSNVQREEKNIRIHE